MTVIACCRGGGNDEDQTAHDIPTMLDGDVEKFFSNFSCLVILLGSLC